MSDWKQIQKYFKDHSGSKLRSDPSDPRVFEDPTDSTRILSISMSADIVPSFEMLDAAVKDVQALLKRSNFDAYAVGTLLGDNLAAVQVVSERTLPKAIGLGSKFNGVAVAFELVESIQLFKERGFASQTVHYWRNR